jgi:hypothetical protein
MTRDRPHSPGPGAEIKVPPEMIEAAKEAVCRYEVDHVDHLVEGGGVALTDGLLTEILRVACKNPS